MFFSRNLGLFAIVQFHPAKILCPLFSSFIYVVPSSCCRPVLVRCYPLQSQKCWRSSIWLWGTCIEVDDFVIKTLRHVRRNHVAIAMFSFETVIMFPSHRILSGTLPKRLSYFRICDSIMFPSHRILTGNLPKGYYPTSVFDFIHFHPAKILCPLFSSFIYVVLSSCSRCFPHTGF